MKRSLALLLAVAFSVPAFAGNIFSNVETYGEIETIGFTNSYDAGRKSVANRVLLGLSMDLVEDVRSNITFAYSNDWDGWNGDSLQTYLNNIYVKEANVVVSNLFGSLEAKIGRQFYGEENSPVMYLGPKHNYHYFVGHDIYSVDGALLTYNGDSLAVSALYAQITDYSDEKLTGLTLDYAFTNNLSAGLYLYDYSDEDHYGVYGAKVDYQNETAKLGAYYAKNYADGFFSHNNRGWMLKVDAALNLNTQALALTPRLTYYHTEKDFYAEDASYNAGILLTNEIQTSFGATAEDWRVFNAGLDFAFKGLEKFTFAFDYINIQQNREWIGNEFNLVAKYNHNDYVTFTLGGAMLTNLPGDQDDIYGAQMGMLIKF